MSESSKLIKQAYLEIKHPVQYVAVKDTVKLSPIEPDREQLNDYLRYQVEAQAQATRTKSERALSRGIPRGLFEYCIGLK